MEQEVFQKVFLQENRKPSKSLVHIWTNYISSAIMNWMQETNEEFKLASPSQGPLSNEFTSFVNHHSIIISLSSFLPLL